MIRKRLGLGILSLLSLLCVQPCFTHAQAATITPVMLTQDENSPMSLIGQKFYHRYLVSHPDVRLWNGAVDVNDDGVGELVLQLRGPNVCHDQHCITSVFMYEPTGWTELFHGSVKSLSTEGVPHQGKMLNLIADGSLWIFNGTRYEPDIRGYGDVVKSDWKDAPIDVLTEASHALGINAGAGEWREQRVKTGIFGADSWLVTVDSAEAKDSTGTRYALIVPYKSTWHCALVFKGTGRLALKPDPDVNAKGVSLLSVESQQGVETFQWKSDGFYHSIAKSFASQ